MTRAEGFEALREALLQAGIRYAIGGSWASAAFGEPRFTNDVDILVSLTETNLTALLRSLSDAFYADEGDARDALRLGRHFNVIHVPTAMKFDLFPAAAYPLGQEELDRALPLTGSGLSEAAVPFVTPEDILLAKLYWFRLGNEVSEVQWRDIEGIVATRGERLDRDYLRQGAGRLGVADLLEKALARG